MTGAYFEEYQMFKEALKQARKIDDNIILKLNATDNNQHLTTEQHTQLCADIFTKLTQIYTQRDEMIKKCASDLDQRISTFRQQINNQSTTQDTNNTTNYGSVEYQMDAEVELMQMESERRQLRNEFEVEQIIRGRTLRLFRSRCPLFQPPI